ncbi:hypothetical protein VULLAG_LOCUS23531 [Vulpes lagopus]
MISGDVLRGDDDTWEEYLDLSTLSQFEDMEASVKKERKEEALLNFVQHRNLNRIECGNTPHGVSKWMDARMIMCDGRKYLISSERQRKNGPLTVGLGFPYSGHF